MSETITILLGEGILRCIEIPTACGPVLAVRLLVEGGPVPLRSAGLPVDPVALVAVHLHHQAIKRHQRRGEALVHRTTVETDHELAVGCLLLFPSAGDAPINAVTAQPAAPRAGTWLCPTALEQVEGRPVRLEARRLPPGVSHDG